MDMGNEADMLAGKGTRTKSRTLRRPTDRVPGKRIRAPLLSTFPSHCIGLSRRLLRPSALSLFSWDWYLPNYLLSLK
jgi:hypothetical protein